MKWLTIKEINEAAKNIDTALDCSVKHWRQLATATFRELVWAKKSFGNILTCGESCALCEHDSRDNSRKCYYCPIYKYGLHCTITPHAKAHNCWGSFLCKSTLPNYRKFHTAANAEYRFLLKVRKWWKEQK